ncbi:carboxypeptidase regulatory-like domain-containing protein [bacterium]|nr:MAG: carboxypeptidase regulatory-like domain-containing protein [bacterium]
MKFQLLLSTFLLGATAASAAPVTISGTARDGSHKNAVLPNATVQLLSSGKNDARTVIASTTTDAKGKFSFPTRDLSNKELLFANVPHQGYSYWTVAYDGGQRLKQVGITVNPQKVDLLVFDTTTQPNAAPLDFQVHHLAIKSTATGLHCIERIVVENPSTLTYLGFGKRKISVLLNVPKIAQNLKLDMPNSDAKLERTTDGWGIVMPITPAAYGTRNAIIYSYDVAWPSKLPWAKTVDLSREAAYPTKFFFVARETEDKELQINAPLLGPEGPQQLPIDGKTETRIVNSIGSPMAMPGAAQTGPAVPAGQQLEVKISRPVSSLFWGFAGLVVAMCLFLPVALLKPKRAERRENVSVNSHTSPRGEENAGFSPLNGFAVAPRLDSSSRELVQKIADLDDAFEAKQVDEATYQNQRAAWKKQLIDSLASVPNEH